MARKLKVDLVCTSIISSPPSAKLIGVGAAKQQAQQARKREQAPKLKEIRLTPQIEDHDYETKQQQSDGSSRLLMPFNSSSKSKGKKDPARKRSLRHSSKI